MTQESKELLFKDLCARLPYGVKVETPYAKEALLLGTIERKGYKRGIRYIDAITDKQTYPIRYIKPYLRPMSSMTEKEKKDYIYLCEKHLDRDADDNVTYYYFDTVESIDWLNAHHFDYRGLIPKGLAISTEEFNPYK